MAVAGLALAGCGGSDPTESPTPIPTPTPTSITIAGTAVKGAALSGATISVKCATGTGTTTTAASGAYTSTVSSGALPCVVKVVGTDGTTYHSVVSGTATNGTFTANVSPLTELVVSHVAGTDPATFFSGFSSTSTVPATSVAAAITYVQTALAGLTSLSGVNPLTDPLVVGDAQDQKIDAVVAALAAAGLSLAEVTASIVQNPAAPNVVAAPLAPPAADCAWLKTGKYRLLSRLEADPKYRFETVQINATALTVTSDADNVVTPMTSDGSCQFNIDGTEDTVKVLVSSGGMIIGHVQSKTVASDRTLLIGVPEQTFPIAEFAGTWNLASWEPGAIGMVGRAVASNVEITLDATGQITAEKDCVGLSACDIASAPFAKFVTNPAGGFDVVDSGVVVGRIFLYKTLAGRKVALYLDGENILGIAVPMAPLGALPAVGTATSFRNLQINADNALSLLTEDASTITATDSVAKTVTRIQASNNRVDMLTYDKPRDGLRYREGNSCTVNNMPFACAETVQLPLPGMGITMTLSAAAQPTQQFYQFSVNKP